MIPVNINQPQSEFLYAFLCFVLPGFRYSTVRGDKVDILYKNIKHAFFQVTNQFFRYFYHNRAQTAK